MQFGCLAAFLAIIGCITVFCAIHQSATGHGRYDTPGWNCDRRGDCQSIPPKPF
jgi:hypothetical protein